MQIGRLYSPLSSYCGCIMKTKNRFHRKFTRLCFLVHLWRTNVWTYHVNYACIVFFCSHLNLFSTRFFFSKKLFHFHIKIWKSCVWIASSSNLVSKFSNFVKDEMLFRHIIKSRRGCLLNAFIIIDEVEEWMAGRTRVWYETIGTGKSQQRTNESLLVHLYKMSRQVCHCAAPALEGPKFNFLETWWFKGLRYRDKEREWERGRKRERDACDMHFEHTHTGGTAFYSW